MLFSSAIFLFIFLPFAIAIYYTALRSNRRLQNIFLCILSIFFYAWGEPAFVFVMLISIIINYFWGKYISQNSSQQKKKLAVTISVIVNLSFLFVFKYLSYTIENINLFIGTDFPIPSITLPIGISFFTFQAMSYVIDVYRGEEYQSDIINVGLYISFFPQLIAGPIVRYATVAQQIKNRKETFEDFSEGVLRFIIGLGKKVLIANTMAVVADYFFDSNVSSLSLTGAWIGALAYTFQIYFDFGGYSDMAIGLGRMFGFRFLENFDYPYISLSITEFWRRWHISLGSWFRDYLYFPLGGSRVEKKSRMIFNLFVVWLATGIWHGANWTFVLWGLMYFMLLVVEKLTGLHNTKKAKPIRYIYTIFFVIMGWVIFRSESVGNAVNYIASMLGLSGTIVDNSALFYLKENIICFILATVCSTPVIKHLNEKYLANKIGEIVVSVILALVFLVSVIYIVKGTYNPFIYFNF
ncbi:MAG: MBOAT family protein [Clostridia bacterium]|nr:MBOAT family protein [Clostridia bacterium]